MVNAVYDHIIAILIVGVIFVGAVVVLPTVSFANLRALDQQQLRNTALNVFNVMLLDTGEPAHWGSLDPFDMNDVERFGLASVQDSAFFVLDPMKVQRLVVGNPSGYLEYETLRNILSLQDYGFRMSIIPVFNVTAKDSRQGNNLRFEVSVSSHEKIPIPNAHVEATLVYYTNEMMLAHVENLTNALGQCTIEKEVPSDVSDYVVVLKTTVAGLTVLSSSYMEGAHQHLMNVSMVGNNVTIHIPEGPGWEKGASGARWVEDVLLVNKDEVYSVHDGTQDDKITYGAGHWGWSRLIYGLSSFEPIFMIFGISVPNPRRFVIYLGPYTTASGFPVLDYGGGPVSTGRVLLLTRSVSISGLKYIAKLWFWKESP